MRGQLALSKYIYSRLSLVNMV